MKKCWKKGNETTTVTGHGARPALFIVLSVITGNLMFYYFEGKYVNPIYIFREIILITLWKLDKIAPNYVTPVKR